MKEQGRSLEPAGTAGVVVVVDGWVGGGGSDPTFVGGAEQQERTLIPLSPVCRTAAKRILNVTNQVEYFMTGRLDECPVMEAHHQPINPPVKCVGSAL